MKFLVVGILLLQFGQRAPLTPAETLLEPALLKAINDQPISAAAVSTIEGLDRAAGEIWLTCAPGRCTTAGHAGSKLQSLIAAKTLAAPPRTIRMVSAVDPAALARAKAAVHVAEAARPIQIIRGLWSTAGIGDEVAEVFSKHGGVAVETRSFEDVGQLRLEAYGVPVTTVVANPEMSNQHAAFVAAATAYFLATLPNNGSEALLSHLMVGAHARLAEDGRRAVAQMGSQQRASGEVLAMFANAIDREQRRIRSFEQFMPAPVDPQLHSRIVDMENAISGVWTSIGITPSPFVPPAQRIRGRGGEDRRVPSRASMTPLPKVDLPTAFLKFENVETVVAELGNFIDGKRTISDIRDAVSAEFSPIALPVVVEYFERLVKAGAISVR